MKGSTLAGAELGDGGERPGWCWAHGRMEASQRSGVLVVKKLANHRHGGEGGWWGAPTTTSGASGGCLISAHHERRRKHKGWKDGAAGITDQRLDSGKGDRRTEIRRRRREVRDVGACGYFSFHFTRWSVGRGGISLERRASLLRVRKPGPKAFRNRQRCRCCGSQTGKSFNGWRNISYKVSSIQS
jgi:hypothetical protein